MIDYADLHAVIREILDICETREIPDRHGERISSCSETCIGEIETIATKALEVVASAKNTKKRTEPVKRS